MTLHTISRGIFLAAVCCSIIGCTRQQSRPQTSADEYYTCSMDPQVIENKPGNCPICHMPLIKVKKNELKPGQIRLSAQQIALANITFDTVRSRPLEQEITMTGTVAIDQNGTQAVAARVGGRVESLAIKSAGEHVLAGQELFTVYSEEFSSAQQEYLFALQQQGGASLLDAAKNKLLVMGMTAPQIAALSSTKHALHALPVIARAEGYVTDVAVAEGAYVQAGATVFRFAPLHALWVEAQVYLPYLPFLSIGTAAEFSIPAAGSAQFTGNVIFIDPQIQAPSRNVLARFALNNSEGNIKPGMLVNITVHTKPLKAYAVPLGAVMQDRLGATVWVRNADGAFENKMVTLGIQTGSVAEISDGLKEGDVVVVTGAYLLNSEYIFKRGASPMEGHESMPGMSM